MRTLSRLAIGPKFQSGRGLVVSSRNTDERSACTRFLRRINWAGSMFSAVLLVLGCLLQRNLVTTEGHHGTNRQVLYAVHMDGGAGAAGALAEQHGLDFIQRVGSLEDVYTLRGSRGRPDRATFESRLSTAIGVHQVQRQHSHDRDQRVPLTGPDLRTTQGSQRRESASDRQRDQSLTFNDPLWPMQWELFAQGEYNSSGVDLNVMPVWMNNVTGDGVVVSIIDDGVDHTNKDLKRNFEALASFDLHASHGLSHDPMPERDGESSHGTRCAGEVAMEANNSYCGVGVAFNARIGGIIHIYVCSWGPRDDGATVDGPQSLTARALRLGAHKGRGGKGSIFVWAAGNGGMQRDHCGADGYVNSIYSIAVGSCSLSCEQPVKEQRLVTVTAVDDGCVARFPGTSSAAPLAAGILALCLEVNPELTWRDAQHLIAKTAKIPDPDEPSWTINAAGYHVHHRYGFGVLDAGLMVQQAVHFDTVTPQRKCIQGGALHPTRILSPGGVASVNIQSEACLGSTDEINTLEHVQVSVSISSVCRGDLSISLRSPAGTVSLLLEPRPNDASSAGLKNWTLMTVHCWGEQPRGLWALQGPLQSIVSMGSRHPVPHRGEDQRGRYPPLDLIQWVYQMERDGKVRAADISVPARHKLHQRDVSQTSSMESRPSAVKEPRGTKTTRENRSLPAQSLQEGVSSRTLQIQEEEEEPSRGRNKQNHG
ncbi:neuroendocrine convertase 1-like [Pseudoliparis swirei]|uniref:neuroendocrine convertase 1-like n=1 Tax=Pseudoliparis swirei TaxID=2059687 RepID=UPI0024BE06BF|nr:neuroendocrine convertase 1-like [Pseudoliparis swirei]